MAMKSAVIIEVNKNYQIYTYTMPYGRPLQECYDAAQDVIKEIIDFSRAMEKQQEENKAQEEISKEPIENVQE